MGHVIPLGAPQKPAIGPFDAPKEVGVADASQQPYFSGLGSLQGAICKTQVGVVESFPKASRAGIQLPI